MATDKAMSSALDKMANTLAIPEWSFLEMILDDEDIPLYALSGFVRSPNDFLTLACGGVTEGEFSRKVPGLYALGVREFIDHSGLELDYTAVDVRRLYDSVGNPKGTRRIPIRREVLETFAAADVTDTEDIVDIANLFYRGSSTPWQRHIMSILKCVPYWVENFPETKGNPDAMKRFASSKSVLYYYRAMVQAGITDLKSAYLILENDIDARWLRKAGEKQWMKGDAEMIVRCYGLRVEDESFGRLVHEFERCFGAPPRGSNFDTCGYLHENLGLPALTYFRDYNELLGMQAPGRIGYVVGTHRQSLSEGVPIGLRALLKEDLALMRAARSGVGAEPDRRLI